MVLVISAVLLIGLIYLYIENKAIKVETIPIKLPLMDSAMKGTKIVHLSDLHFPRQGIVTSRLVEKVKEQGPNAIVFTGDLVQAGRKFPKNKIQDLFNELVSIAPTYAVTGNHDIVNGKLSDWETVLSDAGVTLLLDKAAWLPINGSGLLMMGLAEKSDFEMAPKPILKNIKVPKGKEKETKILLAHHPEFLEEYLMDQTRAPDLILSGHAHGGQIRLPYYGGLFAPGQGWLPEYTAGVYYDPDKPDKRMIVSRGIGNSSFPFRVNNRAEVLVIELK